MGEDVDPLTTGAASMSHRGILIVMAVLVAAGTIAGTVFGSAKFGTGIFFGGVLAFANYFWLDRSTKAIFQPDAVTSTGMMAMRYILRYIVIGLVLFGIYETGILPIAAVIAGLGAFALAVAIYGVRSIFTSSI
ncbi:MAG: ATP synthase subunit I [Acidobacteria bacterium]|nr:ATP synthase subunit I [Acidobacteriota bacterium]